MSRTLRLMVDFEIEGDEPHVGFDEELAEQVGVALQEYDDEYGILSIPHDEDPNSEEECACSITAVSVRMENGELITRRILTYTPVE